MSLDIEGRSPFDDEKKQGRMNSALKTMIAFKAKACTFEKSARKPAFDNTDESNLFPIRVRWHEAISELPQLEVDLLLKSDRRLNEAVLLGKSATAIVATSIDDASFRTHRSCSGIVTSILGPTAFDTGYWQWTVRIQSELWLLTQTRRCRIFENKTVVEILEICLQDCDLHLNYNLASLSSLRIFAKRRYCVQYNETDFDFMSRLLEEEGLFYWLDADGKVAFGEDSTIAKQPPPGWQTKVTLSFVDGHVESEPRLWNWRQERRFTPGRFTSRDFSFLSAERAYFATHGDKNASASIQQFPAGVAKWYGSDAELQRRDPADATKLEIQAQKDRLARVRMQEIAVSGACIEAAGNFAMTAPGCRIEIEKSDAHDIDGDFLVTRQHIACSVPPPFATATSVPTAFECRLNLIPLSMPFRPAQRTRKPVIAGTQSAIVVGLKNADAIHTDSFGRVRVRFPWAVASNASDVLSTEIVENDGISCWLRVAQPCAGNHHGMLALPRVGHEVIVGFENGDPDAPIVLGSVFNSQHAPPYELPEHRRLIGLKSRIDCNPAEGRDSNRQTMDFSGFEIRDTPADASLHLHGHHRVILDSGDRITTVAARTYQAYVGRSEVHFVGAGIGIDFFDLIKLGYAPVYRPGEGNVGGSVFLNVAALYKPEFTFGRLSTDQPWPVQEVDASPFAERIDFTVGKHFQYASKGVHVTHSSTFVVTPPLGPLGSKQWPWEFPGNSGLAKFGSLFRKLNKSSVQEYILGSKFSLHDGLRTIVDREGTIARTGQLADPPHPVLQKVIDSAWVLWEASITTSRLLTTLSPAGEESVAIAAKLCDLTATVLALFLKGVETRLILDARARTLGPLVEKGSGPLAKILSDQQLEPLQVSSINTRLTNSMFPDQGWKRTFSYVKEFLKLAFSPSFETGKDSKRIDKGEYYTCVARNQITSIGGCSIVVAKDLALTRCTGGTIANDAAKFVVKTRSHAPGQIENLNDGNDEENERVAHLVLDGSSFELRNRRFCIYASESSFRIAAAAPKLPIHDFEPALPKDPDDDGFSIVGDVNGLELRFGNSAVTLSADGVKVSARSLEYCGSGGKSIFMVKQNGDATFNGNNIRVDALKIEEKAMKIDLKQ